MVQNINYYECINTIGKKRLPLLGLGSMDYMKSSDTIGLVLTPTFVRILSFLSGVSQGTYKTPPMEIGNKMS